MLCCFLLVYIICLGQHSMLTSILSYHFFVVATRIWFLYSCWWFLLCLCLWSIALKVVCCWVFCFHFFFYFWGRFCYCLCGMWSWLKAWYYLRVQICYGIWLTISQWQPLSWDFTSKEGGKHAWYYLLVTLLDGFMVDFLLLFSLPLGVWSV